jgi:phage protein D/phage baseplate assembly protein gpV
MPQTQELISQMYLKIGGSNVSEEIYDNCAYIEVDDSLLFPDMFSIRLRDPRFKWADSDTFALGKPVEITVQGESGKIKLIGGEITAIEPEFDQTVAPTTLIRGYDQSHRLHRVKQAKTYIQVTDSDIAKKIAQETSLKAKVDSTSKVHEYVCQDNQTNMEFLQDRAKRIGYRMYVEEGVLNFRKIPESEPQIPVLEWGINLLEFQSRLTSAHQVTEVIIHGWDPNTKKEIIGRATTPQDTPQVGEQSSGGDAAKKAFNIESKEIITNRPVATQAEADDLAQSVCDEMGNTFVQAEGTCGGNPAVNAGAIVELKNIGQRFSGRYRITHAVHRYDDLGYTTHFEISGHRANTLGELLAVKDEKKHSVMQGIVTDNNDPSGLARVKVRLPTLLPGSNQSNWARLVTPMAGDGRGFEFIPEIGDEVLVAFEHDDSNYPYVLGALWNGKDKPPSSNDELISGTGMVNQRIIRSSSGHTIILDDTEDAGKVSIVDQTESNSICIDSQDNSLEINTGSKVEIRTQDGNTVVLDNSGIMIESFSNLTIKAQNIKIQADMGLEIKAGTNINIESNMTTVKGSANMNLDGGAMLTAKGGVVKIN